MARIYLIDVDQMPVYVNYFDISLIPSTIFFFNAQHIKVDWGQVFRYFPLDHTYIIIYLL